MKTFQELLQDLHACEEAREWAGNGWRYGLVKADHYRPIEEINLIQPLLTIPLVSVS